MSNNETTQSNVDERIENFHDLSREDLIISIEAVLFASGDPVPKLSLLEFFALSTDDFDEIINVLKRKYSEGRYGFELRKVGDSYAFATVPQAKEVLAEFFSKPIKSKRLSQAAYETLAVVAYNQPVTRADVEQVRGVNSDGAINTLAEKGLVEMVGSLETPGRPSLFAVTDLFLRLYGIADVNQLEPMDMLMYDTIIDFEKSYQNEEAAQSQGILDAGEELGTVY